MVYDARVGVTCGKPRSGAGINIVESDHASTQRSTCVGANQPHTPTPDDGHAGLSDRTAQAHNISHQRSQPSVMLWPLPGDTVDEKLALALAAGFSKVGFTSEPSRWTDVDLGHVCNLLLARDLRAVSMAAVPSSTPVSMLIPEHRPQLLRVLRRSVAIASRLGIDTLILLAGNTLERVSREAQLEQLTDTCKWCAEIGEAANVTFVLESLNSAIDHPGYLLTDAREAVHVVHAVDSAHFRLLFDCYHQQVQRGDAVEALVEALPVTAAVHVADHPGRGELGSGAIEWGKLAAAVREMPFAGEISLEFLPSADALESLKRSHDLFCREFWT